jgi:hypothetical protein
LLKNISMPKLCRALQTIFFNALSIKYAWKLIPGQHWSLLYYTFGISH